MIKLAAILFSGNRGVPVFVLCNLLLFYLVAGIADTWVVVFGVDDDLLLLVGSVWGIWTLVLCLALPIWLFARSIYCCLQKRWIDVCYSWLFGLLCGAFCFIICFAAPGG